MHKYKVTCLTCKSTRVIEIHNTSVGERIDWLETSDNANDPICSGRKRLDGNWGFQCLCGNNDLMTKQEKVHFSNPTSPKPQEISEILNNLNVQQPKFELEMA